MTTSDQIDHDYTDEIVCPWCGFGYSDWWEIGDGRGDGCIINFDCEECGKPFEMWRNVSVTYTTRKLEE